MYRIMVVDDEALHRQGLLSLLRNINTEYILTEARDGVEALKQLDIIDVDIVITDIRMPNMDGLEFLRLLNQRYSSVKVIILSVYSEFDYAKRALKFGAIDYVLKPVKISEITDALIKVQNKIEYERDALKKQTGLEQKLNMTMPVYVDNLLNKLILKQEDNSIDELRRYYNLEQHGCIFLVRMPYIGEILPKDLGRYKEYIRTTFAPKVVIPFQVENQPGLIASLLITRQTSDTRIWSQFKERLQYLSHTEVLVAVGNEVDNLLRAAEQSYEQALMAINFYFYEWEGPIFFQNLEYQANQPAKNHYSQENQIITAIAHGSFNKAYHEFDQLLTEITNQGRTLPEIVRQSIVYSCFNILKAFEGVINNGDCQRILEDINRILTETPVVTELKNRVGVIFSGISKALSDQKNSVKEDVMIHVVEYIQDHFAEDISLETVAKKFYFSSSYLSTMFKNNQGVSFSDYLIGLRMKKAVKLLMQPGGKVRTISNLLGYHDPSYFARVFKSYYGISPEEYRKLNSMCT